MPRSGGRKRKRDREPPKRAEDVYRITSDGLRHVVPYVYEFKTNAKGRWLDRTLIEVFTTEFAAYPEGYYHEAILSGRITINNETVSPDYVIRSNDVIVHWTHRHEPPVRAAVIDIVVDSDEVLVVNKPSTVPMHPCGAYHYNTLSHILNLERNRGIDAMAMGGDARPSSKSDVNGKASLGRDGNGDAGEREMLHIVHRLDRLTSGLTIFAKTPAKAQALGHSIKTGRTQKVYLARVVGYFGANFDDRWQRASFSSEQDVGWAFKSQPPEPPSTPVLPADQAVGQAVGQAAEQSVTHPTSHEPPVRALRTESNAGSSADPRSEGPRVRVQQPIRCVSHKNGIYACAVSDPSVTTFTCVEDEQGHRERGRGRNAQDGNQDGKLAATEFRCLAFNGKTSLIECRPIHGRTHQIRLHLQFLGHPIANDPCYGGTLNYGSEKKSHIPSWLERRASGPPPTLNGSTSSDASNVNGAAQDPASLAANTCLPCTPATPSFEGAAGQEVAMKMEKAPDANEAAKSGTGGIPSSEPWMLPRRDGETLEDFLVRTCRWCNQANQSETVLGLDHTKEGDLHCDGIWLHAEQYSCVNDTHPDQSWSFAVAPPPWGDPTFVEPTSGQDGPEAEAGSI